MLQASISGLGQLAKHFPRRVAAVCRQGVAIFGVRAYDQRIPSGRNQLLVSRLTDRLALFSGESQRHMAMHQMQTLLPALYRIRRLLCRPKDPCPAAGAAYVNPRARIDSGSATAGSLALISPVSGGTVSAQPHRPQARIRQWAVSELSLRPNRCP